MTHTSFASKNDVYSISVSSRLLKFQPLAITFLAHGLQDVFGLKNNKTVAETFLHAKYKKLADVVISKYPTSLNLPLGQFLLNLKQTGDLLYKRFLNPYGDQTYCRFRVERSAVSTQKGLYIYFTDEIVRYVGRSIDPFEKRVNQGYGIIHPKNCFLDGQATNCHLNALIAKEHNRVSFWVCPLNDDDEIKWLERRLIETLHSPWNIALKKEPPLHVSSR